MHGLDHGGVAWVLGLGALFVVDGALMATHHKSLSSHARSHPLLTAVGITTLAIHLRPREYPNALLRRY